MKKESNEKKRLKLVRRLLQKILRKKNGCWEWTGATMGRLGKPKYGYLWINGKTIGARRLAYEILGNNPNPGNLAIDSNCDNPLCINPDHLILSNRKKSNGPNILLEEETT